MPVALLQIYGHINHHFKQSRTRPQYARMELSDPAAIRTQRVRARLKFVIVLKWFLLCSFLIPVVPIFFKLSLAAVQSSKTFIGNSLHEMSMISSSYLSMYIYFCLHMDVVKYKKANEQYVQLFTNILSKVQHLITSQVEPQVPLIENTAC